MANNPILVANNISTLNDAEKKTARENCVLMFKLTSFVLFPAVRKYMDQENMAIADDDRINIQILQGQGPKKWRMRNKNIVKKLKKKVLQTVRLGSNNVAHVNLDEIHYKKETFINGFIDLCKEMGDTEAADILQKYIGPDAIKTPPLFKISTPDDDLIWLNVQLFSILVLHVSPSINKYAANLTSLTDPYEVLKLLKQIGVNQPGILGADTTTITKGSYDGRNSVCHSKKKEIQKDSDLYIDSWGKLCHEVGEAHVAKKIAILKRKMDLRKRLMAKFKARSSNKKKWAVATMNAG